MRKLVKFLTVFLLVLLLVTLSSNADENKGTVKKKLLIVHSYSPDYQWVKEYSRGLKQGLQEVSNRIVYKDFFMDEKRHPATIREMGKKAYSVYIDFQPDVVVAADDASQLYFVVPYLSNKVKTPVVFLGVNADPELYGYPSKNVTGILERANHAENLELIHQLVPSAHTYAILSDGGVTFEEFTKRAGEVLKRAPLRLQGMYSTHSFTKWKQYVLDLQNEVDVIYLLGYQSLMDSEGNWVPSYRSLAWYLSHSRIPEVTQNIFSVKEGLLCSYGQSGTYYGRKAASMVLSLFRGYPVSSLPIEAPKKKGLRVINSTRARILGVEIPPYLIPGTLFYE